MDIKHHYIKKGQGEPLILLHGNGESSEYFAKQIAHFSKKYHVIAMDTRGHGRTPRGKSDFNIRRFAEDLRCFMDEKNIEKANLLGFSDGGNIAMVFAIKYPHRVNKLILNGANLHPRGVKNVVQIPIELGYHLSRLFASRSPEAKAHAEMLGLMVNDPYVHPRYLKRIQAPTLVIAGTKDLIRREHTELIARNIPRAKMRIIKGDHFIASKNWKEFNDIVDRFLADGSVGEEK